MRRGKTFRLFIRGPNACFSRPEMKVERVSYEVPTPSAMRGILEAIFWKPAFRWVVESISILEPVRWETIRRNEVSDKASLKTQAFYVEERRIQRAALVLKEVAYVVEAHQELTGKEPEGNPIKKLEEIFERRARKGQCFHRPYLGTREFAVEEFRLLGKEDPIDPIDENKDLGWMLYDLDFSDPKRPQPLFFHAVMQKGIVRVPHPDSEELKR